MHRAVSRSTNEGEDSTIPSSGRYMVGNFAPESTQFAMGLVKSVPGRPGRPGRPRRGFFVPSPALNSGTNLEHPTPIRWTTLVGRASILFCLANLGRFATTTVQPVTRTFFPRKALLSALKPPGALYKNHLRAYQYSFACLVQVIFVFGGTDRSSSERAQTPPKKRHEAKP